MNIIKSILIRSTEKDCMVYLHLMIRTVNVYID